MKKAYWVKEPIFEILFAVIFSLILLILAWNAFKYSERFSEVNEDCAREMEFKPKLFSVLKKISGGDEFDKNYLFELNKSAKYFEKKSINLSIGFAVVALMFFSFFRVLNLYRLKLFSLLFVSSIAFIVGIYAPIMTISFYKNIPILGDVLIQFQSRSIIESLQTLLLSKNYFVATVLCFFSLVIPAFKTAFMFIKIIYLKNNPTSKQFFFHKILEKFSMAEIFTICIFLVYFTVSEGNESQASIHIGFYYFFCYVMVSIYCSSIINKEY